MDRVYDTDFESRLSFVNVPTKVKGVREKAIALGTYKSRTNRFESNKYVFDLNYCEARSYQWWVFVLRVGNTIFFNNAHYSMQTQMHQNMAWNVLTCEMPGAHGLKVVTVNYREGLQNLSGAIDKRREEIRALRAQIANPRSRAETNAWRLKMIKRIQREIKEIRKIKPAIDLQLRVNEKMKNAAEMEQWERERAREQAKERRYLARRKREQEQELSPTYPMYDSEITETL